MLNIANIEKGDLIIDTRRNLTGIIIEHNNISCVIQWTIKRDTFKKTVPGIEIKNKIKETFTNVYIRKMIMKKEYLLNKSH